MFRNGGSLRRQEKWTFGGEHVEAAKSKRAFIVVLNSLYDLGTLPTRVFFKIFDTKLFQILLCGWEIWSMDRFDNVERIQLYACKRFMCIGNNVRSDADLGDCGRWPIYIEPIKLCLNIGPDY